jgi:hypothetical protein
MTRNAPLVVMLLFLSRSTPSPAAPEEKALAVSAGIAVVAENSPASVGPALILDYLYGISESVWLRASAGSSAHESFGVFAAHATFGVTYALDVVKYVPSATLGAGLLVLARKDQDLEARPVFEIGLGIDRLLSRQASLGAHARLQSFASDTLYVNAGLRFCYRFDFF